jgi:superfamily II DNA or RNA helicase
LPRILKEADLKLKELRERGQRDAGGLVVAADSEHARAIAKLLREATGRAPIVVLHTDSRSAERLVTFTNSRDPWIVAVNMVSEGVDIPRLRVGVYATAAKTPLVFRQIVGRFVRTRPGQPIEASWLYIPADPVLRNHASTVEDELRHALHRKQRGELEEFERLERAQTEPSPGLAFEPLSAEVAAQMTLFGPAPKAPGKRTAPVPVPDHDGPVEIPAFERRAQLRKERHRLVSEVRRRDGTSQREVNAWLNRTIGIPSVDDATLAQLERSVELLVDTLTKRSRARA